LPAALGGKPGTKTGGDVLSVDNGRFDPVALMGSFAVLAIDIVVEIIWGYSLT